MKGDEKLWFMLFLFDEKKKTTKFKEEMML